MGLASPPRHVDGAIGSNCRAGECEGIRQTREPPPHPDSGNQSGSEHSKRKRRMIPEVD